MAGQEDLSLTPDLIRDPDRRRERENERRIQEFVRRLIASQLQQTSSYAKSFLVGE